MRELQLTHRPASLVKTNWFIKTEALKTITFKNGLVEFQYKSPNVKEITIESVSTSDIDPIYMDALVESLNKKKWLEIAN